MLTELVKHLFPRLVRERDLRLTYTFCLGGLAFTSFLVSERHRPAAALLLQPRAGAPPTRSIQFLETRVWGGAYLRSLHRLASHALLVLLALHTLRVILTGAFLDPRQLNWIVGCSLLFLAVFGAYTGYLLPMDQLAYWATQTGMELVRALPLGDALRALLVPDDVGGPLSLLRFYALHVVIVPLAMLGAVDAALLRDPPAEGPAALPMSGYVRSSPHFFRPVEAGAAAGHRRPAAARGARAGAARAAGRSGARAEPRQVRVVPAVDPGAGELQHARRSTSRSRSRRSWSRCPGCRCRSWSSARWFPREHALARPGGARRRAFSCWP